MRKRKAFHAGSSQDDEGDDDEDEDESEGFDADTQEILRAMRGEGDDEDTSSSEESSGQSFGDRFWEKNFILAARVTKYLGATCVVAVFLFFVALVLKAFLR